MATIRQCKMLSARAREAGMQYDFDSFKDLQNGEVDDKIKEIEAYKLACKDQLQPVKEQIKEAKAEASTLLTDVQYGLCFKKVCDYYARLGNSVEQMEPSFADRLNRFAKLYIENRKRLVEGVSSSSLFVQQRAYQISQEQSDEFNASVNCEVI